MAHHTGHRGRPGLSSANLVATDTIAAIATATARAALGIVRVSGPTALAIARTIAAPEPLARHAAYRSFRSSSGDILDTGILIYFPGPNSATGEDVCEFHAHGNPLVLQELLQQICRLGARLAHPGEFSERAYRNGKIDLAQAEAIADFIDSRSMRAARSAMRSLSGEFSARVYNLIEQLTTARVAIEGAIDFPDDVPGTQLAAELILRSTLIDQELAGLLRSGRQGARLNTGYTVALVGAPNVGKSTLLNRLAGTDRAIVSDTPGTTRDLIEVDLVLQDLTLRLVDTAGLRTAGNAIEQEGIRRTTSVMATADIVLLVTDTPDLIDPAAQLAQLGYREVLAVAVIVVHNKADLRGPPPVAPLATSTAHVSLSAREGTGIDALTAAIAKALGVSVADETEFIARTRHIVALEQARAELQPIDFELAAAAPELAAEALRRAALALAAITGGGDSEELLGQIFARFCIGK